MYVREKLASKNFVGKTEWDSYNKASKWIYNNLYNLQDEISNKLDYVMENVAGDLPTCRLTIFCLVDEGAEFTSMCNACKELHQLFYLNKKDECSTCKLIPYRKRIQEKVEIKRGYYVENLFKGKVRRKRKSTD